MTLLGAWLLTPVYWNWAGRSQLIAVACLSSFHLLFDLTGGAGRDLHNLKMHEPADTGDNVNMYDLLSSCSRPLGLRGLAKIAASSKDLRDTCIAVVRRDARNLLLVAVIEAGRDSSKQAQHMQAVKAGSVVPEAFAKGAVWDPNCPVCEAAEGAARTPNCPECESASMMGNGFEVLAKCTPLTPLLTALRVLASCKPPAVIVPTLYEHWHAHGRTVMNSIQSLAAAQAEDRRRAVLMHRAHMRRAKDMRPPEAGEGEPSEGDKEDCADPSMSSGRTKLSKRLPTKSRRRIVMIACVRCWMSCQTETSLL